MDILRRHTKSKVLLGLYFLWWIFVLYYCFSLTKQIKPTCDFSPLAIVFISLLLGFTYAIVFFIKSLTTREPNKTDYLIFLGLITLPLVIGGLYVMSNS
jgi:hypothetical protein